MIGHLLLLAASVSVASASAPPAAASAAAYQPVRVTAQATVSIRIVSGASFGPGYTQQVAGAARRSARLANADGTVRAAELLEFQ